MTMTFALHHASLFVRDVNASAEFYARVLGLQEIPNRVGKDYIRWFLIDEFRTLHLIGGDPEAKRPRQFSTHLALATPAFDGALAHLERQGITYVNLARGPASRTFGKTASARFIFRTRTAIGSRLTTPWRILERAAAGKRAANILHSAVGSLAPRICHAFT